jgi:predicted dehydrogenase
MKAIPTAICSFGMSGKLFHAPFIDVNPKFDLYGVLERTKNLAKESYPKIKTFRTLDALLDDEAVELVILNTPNITHYQMAKQILNAEKHLVVEKPFTVSVAEANELIDLAKAKHVLLSVFQNRRWDSDFRTVQKVLNQGLIGDLVDAELHFDRYEPNLSYKVHKETPTEGVGSLYDLGSHIIDQALQLFGMPEAVFAHLATFRKNSKVDDYFDLKLFYPTHNVTLKSSYFVREPLPAYIFNGTQGTFIKTRSDIQEADLQKGIKPNTKNWGVEPTSTQGLLHIMKGTQSHKEFISSEPGNYMAYFDSIYETIRNNAAVPVSAEDGRSVIQIIEAAKKSNAQKKVVDL